MDCTFRSTRSDGHPGLTCLALATEKVDPSLVESANTYWETLGSPYRWSIGSDLCRTHADSIYMFDEALSDGDFSKALTTPKKEGPYG